MEAENLLETLYLCPLKYLISFVPTDTITLSTLLMMFEFSTQKSRAVSVISLIFAPLMEQLNTVLYLVLILSSSIFDVIEVPKMTAAFSVRMLGKLALGAHCESCVFT